MELWFWAAVLGAVLAGVSNFIFKIAAKRGFNSELFSLYGGLHSIVLTSLAIALFETPNLWSLPMVACAMLAAGGLASVAGISKVYALRHIDSTIFFPLFKLLAPALAIVAGVTLFSESFSSLEWFGMVLGLLVPLLLITPAENSRQMNLSAGLVLVVVTALLSAAGAIIGKYATDVGMSALVALWYLSLGIAVTAWLIMLYKRGWQGVRREVAQDSSVGLIVAAVFRSALITAAVWCIFYAYAAGGPLAIVQTINSLYILIPIVLAIVVYSEHWNLQKVIAVVFSVLSLIFLG